MIGSPKVASSVSVLKHLEQCHVNEQSRASSHRTDPSRPAASDVVGRPSRTDVLVMLDFDGVLADTRDRFCAAMVRGFARVGRDDLASPDKVLELLDDNWFDALTREGLTTADRVVLDHEYQAGLRPYEALPAFPGVAAAVAAIARRCPVVVITSTKTEVVRSFLPAHGIVGVSDVIGSDVETSKVRKISRAVDEHGARRAWYAGDTAGDIVEGRRAGAATIAVGWGWHSVERLLAAAPDHVARTPAELARIIETATSV